MKRTDKRQQWLSRGILVSAIAVMAAAVWFGGQAQRDASERGSAKVDAGTQLLTARLDMETGIRGFLLTGQESFLDPYRKGVASYTATQDRALGIADDARLGDLLDDQEMLTGSWVTLAKASIERRRLGKTSSVTALRVRKQLMDRFRTANGSYLERAHQTSADDERQAQVILVGLIVALGAVGFLFGYLLVDRPAGRARRRRAQQAEFGELLQFTASEREAQALVGAQLERVAPGSTAAVLAINNSENRLNAATDLADDSVLCDKLRTAVPTACLAIRRGKQFGRREGDDQLVECELCGAKAGSSLCMPALVGGEIIGSVLLTRPEGAFTELQARRLEETVAQAAPVLGNLRNLAIAETRAVTDSLTGLSNTRAATETLGVMAAFASRTAQSLSAVLIDLDHFKRVNDNYGHQIGDEVLAAVGETLKGELRASDFIARYGGEEFLVLLQATPKESAAMVAEKMRHAVRRMRVSGLASRVTASFGVATIPDDAGDADGVLRAADEALYAAKDAGRDTVVTHGETQMAADAKSNGSGAQPDEGRSTPPAEVSSIARSAAGDAQ
jgi:diguanylate cyclase (GGDEF)-like protein